MFAISPSPLLFSGQQLRPGNWPFAGLEPWSFDLIMIDPPWRFLLWSDKGQEKSPQAKYRTMTLAEIMNLPVGDLAASDCLLWAWATAPMLPQAIAALEAWDFRYVTMGAWHKKTVRDKSAFGTGYVLRSALEPFLIGKRGDPVTTKAVRNVVVGKVREHSRKPEEAYIAAEKLMPAARRVEVFSCTNRDGWASWGDEAGKFSGVPA